VSRWRDVLIAGLAVVVFGCASTPVPSGQVASASPWAAPSPSTGPVVGPTDVYVPQHTLTGPSMLAELRGVLVKEGRCLSGVTTHGEAYLLLWPRGYGVEGQGADLAVHDAAGNFVARVGGPLYVVGGEYGRHGDEASLARILVEPLPTDCERASYWLVSGE